MSSNLITGKVLSVSFRFFPCIQWFRFKPSPRRLSGLRVFRGHGVLEKKNHGTHRTHGTNRTNGSYRRRCELLSSEAERQSRRPPTHQTHRWSESDFQTRNASTRPFFM